MTDSVSGSLRFVLIRHGVTDWNLQSRLHGWLDSSITTQSRLEAERVDLSEYLDLINGTTVDVVCSDLGRSVQTTQLIANANGLNFYSDERLRERGFGSLQGQVIDQDTKFSAMWNRYHNRFNYPLDGRGFGEEPEVDFVSRILSFLEHCLCSESDTAKVIVSHGEWLRTFINLYYQRSSWVEGDGIPKNITPLVIDWNRQAIMRLLDDHNNH